MKKLYPLFVAQRAILPNGRKAGLNDDDKDTDVVGGSMPDSRTDTTKFRVDRDIPITDDEARSRVGDKWDKTVDKAKKAIHLVYDGMYGKGGVEDLLKEVNKRTASLSSTIHGLAKDAVTLAGNNLGMARAYFAALCRTSELDLIQEHTDEGKAAPTIKELLPLWSQTKSLIMSSFKEGLNPAEFPSHGAVVEAVKARRESRSPGGTQDQTETQAQKHSSIELRVQDAARGAGFTPRLSEALNILMVHLKWLDEKGQDMAASILNKNAMPEIEKLAKAHGIRDKRKAVGPELSQIAEVV